jgi:putative membrane protein
MVSGKTKGAPAPSLDFADRARVAEAIATAETRTAGEIHCVVARRSGDHSWVPLAWGALLALLLPAILLAAGAGPVDLARGFEGGWRVGHAAGAAGDAARGLALVAGAQALLLLLASTLGLSPKVRARMTPGFVARHGVHRAALDQFLAHGIHLTEGRTGVLIYVSLAEHRAEIVADEAIYAKVDRGVWSGAIAALLAKAKAGDLAGGLCEAVERSGEVLAAHFPPKPDDRNELPNHVVLL